MTSRCDTIPAFHVSPPQAVTVALPNWRTIDHDIPVDFRDDGSSDPILLRLLSLIPMGWARRMVAAVNTAGRRHDYGFGPARLPGSPYYGVTMPMWNLMYRKNIEAMGYPRLAAIHWRALDRVGAIAWERNARKMQVWEWWTYQDFLCDVDKSYVASVDGMTDGKTTGGGEMRSMIAAAVLMLAAGCVSLDTIGGAAKKAGNMAGRPEVGKAVDYIGGVIHPKAPAYEPFRLTGVDTGIVWDASTKLLTVTETPSYAPRVRVIDPLAQAKAIETVTEALGPIASNATPEAVEATDIGGLLEAIGGAGK
jgi:hypothetical protein